MFERSLYDEKFGVWYVAFGNHIELTNHIVLSKNIRNIFHLTAVKEMTEQFFLNSRL